MSAPADDSLEEGSDLDRKFFAVNPNREYRFRAATAGEVAVFEYMERRLLGDEFLFLAIKQIAPGIRLRHWIPAVPHGPIPGGDKNARIIFESLERPRQPRGTLDPSEAPDVQP